MEIRAILVALFLAGCGADDPTASSISFASSASFVSPSLTTLLLPDRLQRVEITGTASSLRDLLLARTLDVTTDDVETTISKMPSAQPARGPGDGPDERSAIPPNESDRREAQRLDYDSSGGDDAGVKEERNETAEEADAPEMDAELPSEHGDTSIVQNNISVDGVRRRAGDSEALVYVVGVLLVAVLILGLIVLSIILGRLLQKEEPPMVLMPPPTGTHWRHDPVFEMPHGYPRPAESPFYEQPLHAPKKEV